MDYILLIIMILVGAVPSIILTLNVPIVVGWKIYRKFKYGYTLYQQNKMNRICHFNEKLTSGYVTIF